MGYIACLLSIWVSVFILGYIGFFILIFSRLRRLLYMYFNRMSNVEVDVFFSSICVVFGWDFFILLYRRVLYNRWGGIYICNFDICEYLMIILYWRKEEKGFIFFKLKLLIIIIIILLINIYIRIMFRIFFFIYNYNILNIY